MKKQFVKKEHSKPFIAKDGALIFELLCPETSDIQNLSVASGYLKPRQKALPHFHRISEEVYYVITGRGRVRVGNDTMNIGAGDAIHIPVGAVHALENTSSRERMKILAISAPPYGDNDIFFVDK